MTTEDKNITEKLEIDYLDFSEKKARFGAQILKQIKRNKKVNNSELIDFIDKKFNHNELLFIAFTTLSQEQTKILISILDEKPSFFSRIFKTKSKCGY